MSDCIVFKNDHSLLKHPAENNSSHLILINADTQESESYWVGFYEKDEGKIRSVYQIAYQTRPSDEEIEAAILKLEPFPVELKQ